MEEDPLVSVIIPTYHRNKRLVRAMESAEEQSYSNLEIIVVNDAPSNELPGKISQKPEVRTICHEENRGGAAARNTGLKIAEGEYVAFLDDDDFFHREKIAEQISKMKEAGRDCFGCFTRHVSYSSEEDLADRNSEVIEEDTDEILYRLLRGFDIRIGGCSSLLLKKESVEEVGGFDERFPRHQDWELLIRLLEKGGIEVVREPLFSKIGYNEPTAEKLRKSKHLYLKNFRCKINSLPEDKRRRVYREHYSILSEKFFQENQNLKGFFWFFKSLKYVKKLSKVSCLQYPPRINNTV